MKYDLTQDPKTGRWHVTYPLPGGGSASLADCPTKDAARETRTALEGQLRHETRDLAEDQRLRGFRRCA